MEKIDKKVASSGTREWSDVGLNIGKGCSHKCLYCYACAFALKIGQINTREEWGTEKLTPRKVPTKAGVIMFPTAHDITPFYLDQSLESIRQMMLAGREIVIVTKAHLECVKAICAEVKKHEGYYDKVLIRVTIGSMNEDICKVWEPGAPSPAERLEALKFAFLSFVRTSVSIEPMLQGPYDAVEVLKAVDMFCSEDIWLGKLNSLRSRMEDGDAKDALIEMIQKEQSDANILMLYDCLKGDRKVKWKDSIKEVLKRNGIEI